MGLCGPSIAASVRATQMGAQTLSETPIGCTHTTAPISLRGLMQHLLQLGIGNMMHSDLLTAMYTKFVRRLRCRTLWVCFVLSLLCCVPVSEQGAGATQSLQLYLLAGTTTQHSDDSYPVLLYRVGKNKRLELAREVVPQSDGIRFVYAWEDAIFALHPHNSATKACIVHTNEPMRADDVTIGHQNATLASTATTIAAPPGSALVLLALWITNLTAPTHPPAESTLLSPGFRAGQQVPVRESNLTLGLTTLTCGTREPREGPTSFRASSVQSKQMISR